LKQSNKPLLEKKRRARINRSLEQLKALLIDTIKSDVSFHEDLLVGIEVINVVTAVLQAFIVMAVFIYTLRYRRMSHI
jgi:Helix-loop-helix DNA-binding domain